jgi:hypothetical protein
MQAEQGKRDIAYSTEKIESQLAHCLWSVITLSQKRGIVLERAFIEAMDRLETHMMEADEYRPDHFSLHRGARSEKPIRFTVYGLRQ